MKKLFKTLTAISGAVLAIAGGILVYQKFFKKEEDFDDEELFEEEEDFGDDEVFEEEKSQDDTDEEAEEIFEEEENTSAVPKEDTDK